MILSSLLMLLKFNLSYLDLFIKQFITAIENIRFEVYLRFIWIQTQNLLLLTEVICWTPHFKFPSVGFSGAGLDRAKFGLNRFQSFLFIVVIVIEILLKTAFWQTSIHSHSLLKILWRSNKDKITFKAIEKHRYGLRETVLKHLKMARYLSQGVKFVSFGISKVIAHFWAFM